MIVPYSIFSPTESGNFTFCEREYLDRLTGRETGTVIVPRGCEFRKSDRNIAYIYSDNPKLTFLKYLKTFLSEGEIRKREITIGENFTNHETSWIGTDGFGVVKDENGRYERFPQIGGIIIGDDVELGAYSLINRGTLGDTIVGNNVFIGHHVVVGHNCRIGDNVFLPTNCVIGGGTVIGNGCTFGMGVIVNPKVELADNMVVGSGSVVTKSFHEDKVLIFGSPARMIRRVRDGEEIKGLPAQ